MILDMTATCSLRFACLDTHYSYDAQLASAQPATSETFMRPTRLNRAAYRDTGTATIISASAGKFTG